MFHARILVLVGAAALAGLGAPAVAGEVNGRGEPIDVNGRSVCAFSGQNDGNPPPGRTQSFGQNVQADRLDPTDYDPDFEPLPGVTYPYPGWACDPNNIDLHGSN